MGVFAVATGDEEVDFIGGGNGEGADAVEGLVDAEGEDLAADEFVFADYDEAEVGAGQGDVVGRRGAFGD